MELYAQTPLVSVYWIPDIQAGYTIWVGMPRLETMKEALAIVEKLMLEKRAARLISNTEDAIVAADEVQQCNAEWFQRMGRMKVLRAWADIPPKSPTARLVLRSLGAGSTRNAIAFAQFPSLLDAKLWIISK